MLEHQKKVLRAVCQDKDLFKKELMKSFAWLNSYEQTQLRIWLRQHFSNSHSSLINEILYPKYHVNHNYS